MLLGRRVPDAKDKSSGALISSPGGWLSRPFPADPPELPGTPRSTPERPEKNTTARRCIASIPSAVSKLCFSRKKPASDRKCDCGGEAGGLHRSATSPPRSRPPRASAGKQKPIPSTGSARSTLHSEIDPARAVSCSSCVDLVVNQPKSAKLEAPGRSWRMHLVFTGNRDAQGCASGPALCTSPRAKAP